MSAAQPTAPESAVQSSVGSQQSSTVTTDPSEIVPVANDASQSAVPVRDGASALSPLPLPDEVVYTLMCSWRGEQLPVQVVETDCLGDVKATLWSLTSVAPERQKLVGLVKGKLPGDEVEVKSLGLSATGSARKFMMVGTPEGQELGPPPPSETEVDIDYSGQDMLDVAQQGARNRRKLAQTIGSYTIDIMQQPQPGKRLLVLDLDYCILDTALWKESNFVADHFARPYLHQFLQAVSPFYDIVIWSQTSWRFLEQKLIELDIIGENARHGYPVISTIDRRAMFSVYSQKNGKPFKHEVKALGLLWAKFPHWTEVNSIAVDDLSRNFAMNPKNGLKLRAYKDAMNYRSTDHELVWVARYLLQLVNFPDFSKLDHTKFKKVKYALPTGVVDPATWVRRNESNSSSNGADVPPESS
ncbi:hypothetical protein OIO90_000723 [Microbotryomycetes sp. JL221]|nr:hypothetical protein OIO90_000723 [Microbotryomycetes sp. JL221]